MDNLIFSGRSNQKLTSDICKILREKNENEFQGKVEIKDFPSGEIYCKYQNNIRGKNVFIVQSMDDPNKSWMELFLLIHTAKLASANKVTLLIPFFSYARQDRKTEPRSPISARLMLDLLEKSGADKIITVDIHNPCIQGFTSLPLDSLLPSNLWVDYIKKNLIKNIKDTKKWTLCAPDLGSSKRILKYGTILKTDFCITHKHRSSATKVESKGLMGDAKGKNVIIIDDMSESLNSLNQCAAILKKNGAKKIYAFVTHLPLTKEGKENLQSQTHIDKIITTDTVGGVVSHDKVKIISVAGLLASAIDCTMNNKSISKLFSITGF